MIADKGLLMRHREKLALMYAEILNIIGELEGECIGEDFPVMESAIMALHLTLEPMGEAECILADMADKGEYE